MTHYKLQIEENDEDSFLLLAIHCSEEPYKMAFMLNKNLNINLKRKRMDIEIVAKKMTTSYAIFEFENPQEYTHFYLVENKCTLQSDTNFQKGSLFALDHSEKIRRVHLLPEFKKADFFLKIETDIELFPIRKVLAQMNAIREVISAYVIENQNIKSYNNLIFN
ncbi:MAG: IPExxxVDY family protein [Flavobacteriaceae bacterium]